MSRLAWYVHRGRAMSAAEMMAHGRKKWRQFRDGLKPPKWPALPLDPQPGFPALPAQSSAPALLREALKRDGAEILAGQWRAFGQRQVQVADPPRWQMDHFLGQDFATAQSAFHLNHRALPDGADIKVVWELSRWNQLVRLAQAAYVLGQPQAGETCLRWLADWVEKNPPYRGWNWTSALEAGLRLIQFCWIDGLLTAARQTAAGALALAALRQRVLPPHVYYVGRYRSFGSSANNHLLGELAGLIQALVRWPALSRWTTDLDDLQPAWQGEVLAQFAEDGGNREQALNYHLFSWELCWQTRTALRAAGRSIAPRVEERLSQAAAFYAAVQSAHEPWDYGDSDSAFVTPFFADETAAIQEWHRWLSSPAQSPAIHYWLGAPPPDVAQSTWVQTRANWQVYSKSGIAVCRRGDWYLRWDLSPLGYLSTAAHGHLDALHLSVWHGGLAWIIDPGTGAYYEDAPLRSYLASWEAHNGPHLPGYSFPQRQGPFLWSAHHSIPRFQEVAEPGLKAELLLPRGAFYRTLTPVGQAAGWQVKDAFAPSAGQPDGQFMVCWQFAPACQIEPVTDRRLRLHRGGDSLEVCLDDSWGKIEMVRPLVSGRDQGDGDWRGVCSPSFRRQQAGPQLRLVAPAKNACVFYTTILVSQRT